MGFITPGKIFDHKRRWTGVPTNPVTHKRRRGRISSESFTIKDQPLIFDDNEIDDDKPTFIPMTITKLEQLPDEILFKIFTHVDVASNQLHLTCKKFNQLFTWDNMGNLYLGNLIKQQYLSNLNDECESYLPILHDILQRYRDRGIRNVKIKQAESMINLFHRYQWCLNVEVFNYQFIFQLPLDFFHNFFITNGADMIVERSERSSYIRHMIKDLNHDLEINEVDYDEMSRMAEMQENQALIETDSTNVREPTPVISETNNNNSPGYTFQIPVPRFPQAYYKDIDKKYSNIKILINHLNFRFSDTNAFISSALSCKLSNGKKYKLIKLVIDHHEFTLNTDAILKSFRILIDTNYLQEVEKIVHMLLEIYYQDENNDNDEDLWNFVKNCKEVELFHILCGYTTPNFIL